MRGSVHIDEGTQLHNHHKQLMNDHLKEEWVYDVWSKPKDVL